MLKACVDSAEFGSQSVAWVDSFKVGAEVISKTLTTSHVTTVIHLPYFDVIDVNRFVNKYYSLSSISLWLRSNVH